MTIFDYITLFYEWKKNQGSNTSDAATALYFYILKEANRQFWPGLIELTQKGAKTDNSWGSKNTFHKALASLVDNGLIELVRQGKNEATPSLVRLLSTVSVPQNGTASRSSVPKSGTVKKVSVPESGTVESGSVPENGTVNHSGVPQNGTLGKNKENDESKSGTLKNFTIPENGTLEAVSVPKNGTPKGTIGDINTSSKLSKENLEEVEEENANKFYKPGEVPVFVLENRRKVLESSNPQPPSSRDVIREYLLSSEVSQSAFEHAAQKLKIKTREEYEEIVHHFIRFNAAHHWANPMEAYQHLIKTISSWNGKNFSKSTKHDASKRKPSQRSGPLVPLPAKDLGTYASHVHLADLDEAELERLCGITGGGPTGTDRGGNPPDAKG